MDSADARAHPPRTRAVFLTWGVPAIVIIAVLIAYANSFSAPFVFDDLGAVQQNPTIRELFSWRVFQPPNDGSTTTGRPLLNLSYALNYTWSGESVLGYHAVNVLIHAGCALLLFGLLKTTASRVTAGSVSGIGSGSRLTLLGSDLWAMFAVLAWALHPLQTESVVGVAQRRELLWGFVYLGACYAFDRATMPGSQRGLTSQESAARNGVRGWLMLSVATCAAGMATKEVMVTAPLMILLYDRTFVAGSFSTAWHSRKRFYLALASTWLLLGYLVVGAAGRRGASAGIGLGVTSWDYLLTQCRALVLYLKLSVWPSPLIVDYGSGVVHSVADVWWQAIIVVALLGLTIWALRVRPVIGFVGAWFFLILAPSSSMLPLVSQTIAEHRMYLPLAGITTIAVAALARATKRAAILPLSAWVIVLAALTVNRNFAYRSATTLWQDTVQKLPSNARAHNNLGLELQREGNLIGAIAQYREAVAIDPRYVPGFYDLGSALLLAGKPEEAVAQLTEAVRLAPDHADAQLALGNALVQAGRPEQAIASYRAALALNAAADVHYNLGVALLGAGDDSGAAAEFEMAVKADPSLANGYFQLGRQAERADDVAAAMSLYQDALRTDPHHQESHRRLGLIAARGGDFTTAASHFQALVEIDEKDADAWANLGNAALARGAAPDALKYYAEALRLRPNDTRTEANLRLARESVRTP